MAADAALWGVGGWWGGPAAVGAAAPCLPPRLAVTQNCSNSTVVEKLEAAVLGTPERQSL